MRVDAIQLEGFRNYESLYAEFSPGVNVFWGENAQGKTNLLEALECLSGMKSHRTRSEKELISFCRNEGKLSARLESRDREFLVEAQLSRTGRRKLFLNHVKLKSSGELAGVLRTVLFCPEDLSLIRAGAAERRRFLDQSISQLRPKYAEALSEYQRLLDHKTRILRDWEENPSLLDVLEEFSDGMARTGAVLIHYRAHFIQKLARAAREIQTDFSGGREELTLTYQTVKTVEDPLLPPAQLYPLLREHQKSHERAELASRSCLSGPHKDDLLTQINGQNARQFASQGQTRTAALSFKLAERELHKEDTGQWPVLLLDDVLSELDARRQDFVLQRITGGQVFITSCELPPAEAHSAKVFHIQNGAFAD